MCAGIIKDWGDCRYGLIDQHTAHKLIVVHRLVQEATQLQYVR